MGDAMSDSSGFFKIMATVQAVLCALESATLVVIVVLSLHEEVVKKMQITTEEGPDKSVSPTTVSGPDLDL